MLRPAPGRPIDWRNPRCVGPSASQDATWLDGTLSPTADIAGPFEAEQCRGDVDSRRLQLFVDIADAGTALAERQASPGVMANVERGTKASQMRETSASSESRGSRGATSRASRLESRGEVDADRAAD